MTSESSADATVAPTFISTIASKIHADYVAAFLIFLIVSFMLIDLKMIRIDERFGDTAIHSQTEESIAQHGVPLSQVMAAAIESATASRPTASETLTTAPARRRSAGGSAIGNGSMHRAV